MSTSSDLLTNNSNTRQIIGDKSLPFSQKNLSLIGSEKEFIYSQPLSPAAHGTTCSITITETNMIIHRNYLQITVNRLGTNTTGYIPASAWFSRIIIESSGGKTIQTLIGQNQFILKQIKYTDQQRMLNGEGNYLDSASRIAAGQNLTTTYWVCLDDFVSVSGDYCVLSPQHQLTYKITIASLRDCISPNDSTGSIANMQLVSEISRCDNFKTRLANLYKYPETFFYPDCKLVTANVLPGTTNISLPLLFNGPVICILFVLQLAANIGVQDAVCSGFLPVTSFSLLNSRNEALVHKTNSIDANFFLKVLAKSQFESNITIENSTSKNIYCFNCSSDIKKALRDGSLCGTRLLTQIDTLNVVVPANGAACVLNAYVMYENSLTMFPESANVIGVI